MTNHLKVLSKNQDQLIVGNHILLFGDVNTKDLDGEFFTPNTLVESSYTKTGQLMVDWEHGHKRDDQDPGEDLILGYVDWKTAKLTDAGLWVERILDRRNEYVHALEPLLELGLVGTSSQAAPGGVKTAENGEIQKWALKRDSLTVNPAEPRMLTTNAIQAIKSIADKLPLSESIAEAIKGYEGRPPKLAEHSAQNKNGGSIMSDQDTDTPVVDAPDKKEAATMKAAYDALDTRLTELADSQAAAQEESKNQFTQILELMEEAPPAKGVGYHSPQGGTADPDNKSFGDFAMAVMRDDTVRLAKVYGSYKLEKGEKDQSGVTGAGGGFTVPIEYQGQIAAAHDPTALFRPRANVQPIGSPKGQYPSIDQITAVTGGIGDSPWSGGIVARAAAEGEALNESEMAFLGTTWDVNKIGGITQIPNELAQDTVIDMDALLIQMFSTAINQKEDYFYLRGNGAGEPEGILNWAGAIGISPANDNAFVLLDASNMLAQFKPAGMKPQHSAFLMHRSTIPELIAMEASAGGARYMDNLNLAPDATLFGRDVLYHDHLPQEDASGHAVLVDFSAYIIFDYGGLQIAFSPHVGFENDKSTWRFTKRTDGKMQFTDKWTLPSPGSAYTVSPVVYFND